MLMDYELHTAVNTKITELIIKAQEDGLMLDMIVSQTDKYENSRYEQVTYGLGCSKGFNKEKYYFNAIADETSEYFKLADKYYNEPVSYYENVGTVDKYSMKSNPMEYRIDVDTFSRVIRVHHITYGATNNPIYNIIETINLKPSKFQSKFIEKVGV